MVRHTKTTTVLETVKVPLQKTTKTGRTTFAYLRRSTTKKEQSSSLGQQEDGIGILANSLGIPLESIICYSESKSAYEDRTRAEWKKMLIDIDKLKVPCTILCRDTSRLSRNPEDNGNIRTRLFGKRGQKEKPKIENIYFLSDTLVTQNWNMLSDREEVETVLHNNYMESLRTGKKSATGILLKLNNKELPYPPPSGIYRVTKTNEEVYRKTLHEGEETILIYNEKMPFIKRVFEMKAEGKTAKEMSKYLKQYGKINIVPKKIVETIIQNTIYKGEYTHKQTGEVFTLKFKEGQPPIDSILWDKANKTIGKRGNGFGLGQEDHIAKGKLKYETGRSLYMYKAKGKYNAYQTEIKGENGERQTIGIMESAIVKGFLAEVVPKIKSAYYILSHGVDSRNAMAQLENMTDNEKDERVKYVNDCYRILYQRTGMESANIIFKNFDDLLNHLRQLQNSVIDISFELGMSDIDMNRIGRALDILYKTIPKKGSETLEGDSSRREILDDLSCKLQESIDGKQKLKEVLKQATVFDKDNTEKEVRLHQKKELEKKKEELVKKKDTLENDAWDRGFDMNFVNRKKGEIDIDISDIEAQIDLLSESTNMEEYLDRLPEILLNLHELSSRVLCEADYQDMRDDVKKLIEIVSHELILNNKKELKVKLFGALNNLFFCLE